MKDYEELLNCHDEALEKAKSKLPNPKDCPNREIIIAVMVDESIGSADDLEIANTSYNPSLITFKFIKKKILGLTWWEYHSTKTG